MIVKITAGGELCKRDIAQKPRVNYEEKPFTSTFFSLFSLTSYQLAAKG